MHFFSCETKLEKENIMRGNVYLLYRNHASHRPRRSNHTSWAAVIMINPAVEGITEIMIVCLLLILSFISMALNPPTIAPIAKTDHSTNRIVWVDLPLK